MIQPKATVLNLGVPRLTFSSWASASFLMRMFPDYMSLSCRRFFISPAIFHFSVLKLSGNWNWPKVSEEEKIFTVFLQKVSSCRTRVFLERKIYGPAHQNLSRLNDEVLSLCCRDNDRVVQGDWTKLTRLPGSWVLLFNFYLFFPSFEYYRQKYLIENRSFRKKLNGDT